MKPAAGIAALLLACALTGCGSDEPRRQRASGTTTTTGPDGTVTTAAPTTGTTPGTTQGSSPVSTGIPGTPTTGGPGVTDTTTIPPATTTTRRPVQEPARRVATMDVGNDTVFVDEGAVGDGAPVREGSKVRTDKNGRGTVEFDDDPGRCAILQSTEVEVTSMTAAMNSGKLECGGGGGKGVRIRVGDKTVTVVHGQVEVKVAGGTRTVKVTSGEVVVSQPGQKDKPVYVSPKEIDL